MQRDAIEMLALGWVVCASLWTFILFGVDKWIASKPGTTRISESTLCWISAFGGWPGGLLGLILFRHKSAKASFQLKFVGAFFVWAAITAAVLKLSGRI